MSNRDVVHGINSSSVLHPGKPKQRQNGRLSRASVMLALVVAGPYFTISASPSKAASPAVASTVMLDEVDWITEILKLIRELYITLGGDPADLDAIDAQHAMAVVMNFYSVHGLPANMSLANKVKALSAISHLESLLASPPSGQDTTTTAAFFTVIEGIKSLLLPATP